MFQGSMVALATPMHTDGTIDWHKLEQLIEWHIQSGTDAIISVGTTGESATLDFDEHKAVVRFTVDIVKKRIPVIAGAGGNSTREAIELTVSAYQGGCDGTLQVAPYYNKPPQRGLYAHFEQIARAVPLPLVLYNVPGRTACDIAPETTVALAKIQNIVGIKEATPMTRLKELRPYFPKGNDFKIFSGEDGICAQAAVDDLIDGVISVTANVAPKIMSDMMRAGLAGDSTTCLSLNEQLAPLHKALFCETNPIPVKWALYRMGKADLGIRLPLVPLDEAFHNDIESALQHASLL
ncbi:4-hydroxy-tetrahydrodipicolinate synthase [Suttonella ornithocola]|uniref:4-hydroxy-tetrahydrodipicolinate synthase n=1 Tax=Suttonella ornithocola TaxID=279832 RepID=A0A380MQY2_9GAMM|nr:4-hydroxy-tetrahydrodipicolinate synthase [Suttonella ornithocola]SUO94584.1 Dihydrodipicolinate synthase [Suttonella ornithocola]